LRPDDRVGAEHSFRHVEQVHRAALAVHQAVLAAEQLGHDRGHLRAAGEHVVVAAVGDERVVVRAHRGRDPGRDGLLPGAQVGGPLHQVLQEQVVRALLELPDPGHAPVQAECGLLIHGYLPSVRVGDE
jgi:hypothetical protein